MRTYDEMVTAIINAMPSGAEIDALSQEQVANLRKYGTSYDNILYLATPKGQALMDEAARLRASK